ncbi:MAG TPA: hypothetical protein VEC38_05785 [Candidatus Binataceae bacterium]|nr:hypothetical protein [Candidatus Binataceae bacterium]
MKLLKAVRVKTAWMRGQTMTEYALILVTVAAVVISLYSNASTILTSIINQVGPLL